MINANLTLKGSFFKRILSDNAEVPAIVQLSDGSSFELHFMIYKRLILVNSIDKEQKYKLDYDRRIAIIEEILTNYTSFWKSIGHCTISYNIETFRMVDNTNSVVDIDIENKKNKKIILEEYLDSKLSEVSLDVVLRALKSIYDRIKVNYDSTKKANILQGNVDYKLDLFQRRDLSHYLSIILQFTFDISKANIDIDPNTNKFNITIEKN